MLETEQAIEPVREIEKGSVVKSSITYNYAPMTEEQANKLAAENLAGITDADAPVAYAPSYRGERLKLGDIKVWQKAAIADGFYFKSGADGIFGKECEGVAKKAICKKRDENLYKT